MLLGRRGIVGETTIRIKRAYENYDPKDGRRVLVDGLWPRGLTKQMVKVDSWLRDIAPSDDLRKWFQHDPAKWGEFRERYRQELETKKSMLLQIQDWAKKGDVTIIYAAKDEAHNNAVALKELLDELMKKRKK